MPNEKGERLLIPSGDIGREVFLKQIFKLVAASHPVKVVIPGEQQEFGDIQVGFRCPTKGCFHEWRLVEYRGQPCWQEGLTIQTPRCDLCGEFLKTQEEADDGVHAACLKEDEARVEGDDG